MPSTRASSPANDASSPMQLTPRSKVKAMLAAMGDDSDEDNITSPPKPQFSSTESPKSPRKDPIDNTNQDTSDKEESEEDEDDIIKPRGRIAARMHAAMESDLEDQPDDARSRVKKMLAAQTKKTKEPSPVLEENNDSSEDADLPIVSRKHQNRLARTPTPQRESGSRNSESPGGLFVTPASEKGTRQRSEAVGSDDDELPKSLDSSQRLQELVRKKREERQAREAKLAKEKAEKAAKSKDFSDMLDQDDELDGSDSETEKRLTQPIKSARKASKRALEEMKRETQRMSRNMQLAHEARTKKKITKASLFAKFNYRQSNTEPEQIRPTSSSSMLQSEVDMRETTPPTSPSLHTNEVPKILETPLQGPKSFLALDIENDDDELLPLEDILAMKPRKTDKGKGKEVQDIPSSPPNFQQQTKTEPPPAQKNNIKGPIQHHVAQGDSDSDLEITYSPRTRNRKKKLDAIFDRIPTQRAQESHSIQALRMLAHLNSPGKKNKGKNAKSSMTNPELQMSLQQQIRQQALREKADREQSLRDRGIVVLTAEEREKEMVDVEDLITKARREVDELTKKERGDAKRERKENGEVDPIGDSSDDEDWQEEKEQAELELSGSESENELGADDADGEASGEEEDNEDAMSEDGVEPVINKETTLIDNEASETDSEQDSEVDPDEYENAHVSDQAEEEDDVLPIISGRRRTKNTNILSDDSGDEDEQVSLPMDRTPAPTKFIASPMPPKTVSPLAPNSVLRSATKTFIPGLTVAGPAGLGLTQIFQGTMDDNSQTQVFSDITTVPETSSGSNGQDSLDFLRRMPPPSLPPFESTVEEDLQDIVMDSQPEVSQIQVPASQPPEEDSPPIQFQLSQSQTHEFDSLVDNPFATQFSDFPEQTQDVGFRVETPIVNRFVSQSQAPQSTVPYSTVDTLLIERETTLEYENSPTVKKPGRLRRRNQVQRQSNEDEDDAGENVNIEGKGEFAISANAFDVMRKAAKKKTLVDDFDRNKSKAKHMVLEQAEESEDEYAGLGGASDDESGGEDDALVKAMIDDEAGKEADERELAAFFADKERAKDSKDVEKLFKDITNGMLRRKRGGDFSLSDSEDDGEARRTQKRKEFARMRKALLEDERIGKIAQNPKQSAFLAAIEDRERDDEIDFLDAYEDSQEVFESQTQEESQNKDVEMSDVIQVPGSQPDTLMGPPKRKRSDDYSDIENRPPPNLRRTKGTKRPSNLSEIRESLSSLIEEPNALVDADNDSDLEDSDLEIIAGDDADKDGEASGSGTDREARKVKEPRDPFATRRNHGIHIVDRISLKRASSSNINNNISTTTKLAFAAPSTTSSLYSVKVPPLLRKATSNLSTTSNSSGIASLTGGNKASLVEGTGSGIKRGGSKKSGIAYQARETERRKKVEEGEKRREKKKFKGAEKRRGEVGGLFGRGSFE